MSMSKLRLDTDPNLQRIELYLRGKDMQLIENEKGELVERIVVIGEPKMNDKGIQAIMWLLQNIYTPSIVQGNLTEEKHENVVCDIISDLSTDMATNLHRWGIDVYDFDHIIDAISPLINLYLSRTINNEERKALVPTMQHIERSIPERPEPSPGLFGTIKNTFGGR